MVITKNHSKGIVPLTGKDATIIAESSGTFLGLSCASALCTYLSIRIKLDKSKSNKTIQQEATLVETEQDEEAFASEAIPASYTSVQSRN